MKKLKETRKSGYINLIAIAVIGVSVYIGFEPLFEKVGGGVEARVIGASFGAIFVIVLTMYLLNKQTEIEQESKKSEKVFEEKVVLYKSMLARTKDMLRDGKVSSEETTELSFSMVELQMVGADETINAFSSVLDKINKIFNQQVGDPVDLEDVERLLDWAETTRSMRLYSETIKLYELVLKKLESTQDQVQRVRFYDMAFFLGSYCLDEVKD